MFKNQFRAYTKRQYNLQFMEFRTKQKVALKGVKEGVTESNFALCFDSDKLQAERLKFLLDETLHLKQI